MPTTIRSPARYTRPAIALHWIVAMMLVGSFSLGLYMSDLPISPWKLQYFSWHKWNGITILALALLRLLWRLTHPAPPPAPGLPRWQALAAHGAHVGLYVLLFVIPLSGWIYSSASGYPVVYLGIKSLQLPDLVARNKETAETLKSVHQFLNWSLLALVSIHVAAALKHHFLDRDETLRRMLPFLRRP